MPLYTVRRRILVVKKIIAAVISACVSISGMAVSAADITSKYDTGEFTVSGQCEEARVNGMIALKALDKQGNIVHISYAEADFDGSFSYTFKMPQTADTGMYDLWLGAARLDKPEVQSFKHIKPADFEALIKGIQEVSAGDGSEAATDAAAQKIYEIIGDNMDVFIPDAMYYDKLSAAQSKKIAKEILKDRTDYDSICEGALRGYAVQVLNVLTEDYSVILEKYKDIYKLENAQCYELYTSLTDKKRFSEIFGAYSFESTEDVVKAFNETAVLSAIETSKPGEIKKIFETYAKVFPFSLDTYNSSVDNRDAVAFGLAGQKIESMTALEDKIDELCAKKPSSGGGGGGGGTSSGKASGTVQVNVQDYTKGDTEAANTKRFSDLTGSEWAEEAICALADRGIISGVSEGIFEPERSIKREEFVKLILSAFGIDGGEYEDCGFEDMDAEFWAYPYVCRAYKLGIVKGVDDNHFGTNGNISRQDMAVIISRAASTVGIELASTGDIPNFTDSDEIDSYAADSVNKLSAAGIINGMGDGAFAPKQFATRAQTAVILYRIIK